MPEGRCCRPRCGYDANPWHRHAAFPNQLRDDAINNIDWDREPDPSKCASAGNEGGVDPDQPAGIVEQRSAGVAGLIGASVWIAL
jgi:hypothetical protein